MRSNPYLPDLAVLRKIKRQTHDTKTFTFTFLDEERQRRFNPQPGQFVIISIPGVGECAMSLSSGRRSASFDLTIRKVGNVTGMLFQMKPGDMVGIRGPYGRGWPMDRAEGKDILIVTGGCGCGTLRPVILELYHEREKYGRVELLYGARAPRDEIFADEYDEWEKIPDTCIRLAVDALPRGVSWRHKIGVVTVLFEDLRTKPDNSIVFTCGPEIMMKYVVKGLLERGFGEDQLYLSMERRMRCGVGKCGHCQIGPYYVCKDGPVFPYTELKGLPDTII